MHDARAGGVVKVQDTDIKITLAARYLSSNWLGSAERLKNMKIEF